MPASEEIAYLNQIEDLHQALTAQEEQIVRLLSEQDDYPELLWSAVWNSRMHEALASILEINGTYRQLLPPARYEHLHDIHLEAADHSTRHARFLALHIMLLQKGQASEAIRVLRQATSESRLSNNAIQRASAMLRDMQ